ncbi:chitin deacetylase family protein [Crocosphaera chwakensis]|uniref:Peptidoglycan N-acetylglucosamine deacetylase n=1 Tax=Crocosphaera chwakensis CCY0110 TaxID=391612 RepID=A3IRA7_9CHRO|nr:chitin deacetylase family protein [Crocosphaera chwakensis]EAZ90909.1 Peptidoglycan N-acetylglucosamine deacetylase [Crocosphaera chwakensis CCY0110]
MLNFKTFRLSFILLPTVFLLCLGLIALKQPQWLFRIIIKVAPGVHYFAETDDKVIAITIDDGPNSITTPKILETLEENDVNVTFFLISERIEDNELIVQNIINNGHEVGNHMVKDKKSIFLSLEEFEQEFLTADKTLNQFLSDDSSKVKWFRPGGGWYNSQMLNIVKKYNYQTVLGSIFPYDTHIPSSKFASYQILTNLRPGAIIVLHDSGRDGHSGEWGKRTNVTLKKIIPEIKKRGYRIVTLSEMLSPHEYE